MAMWKQAAGSMLAGTLTGGGQSRGGRGSSARCQPAAMRTQRPGACPSNRGRVPPAPGPAGAAGLDAEHPQHCFVPPSCLAEASCSVAET